MKAMRAMGVLRKRTDERVNHQLRLGLLSGIIYHAPSKTHKTKREHCADEFGRRLPRLAEHHVQCDAAKN